MSISLSHYISLSRCAIRLTSKTNHENPDRERDRTWHNNFSLPSMNKAFSMWVSYAGVYNDKNERNRRYYPKER